MANWFLTGMPRQFNKDRIVSSILQEQAYIYIASGDKALSVAVQMSIACIRIQGSHSWLQVVGNVNLILIAFPDPSVSPS